LTISKIKHIKRALKEINIRNFLFDSIYSFIASCIIAIENPLLYLLLMLLSQSSHEFEHAIRDILAFYRKSFNTNDNSSHVICWRM